MRVSQLEQCRGAASRFTHHHTCRLYLDAVALAVEVLKLAVTGRNNTSLPSICLLIKGRRDDIGRVNVEILSDLRVLESPVREKRGGGFIPKESPN